MEAHRRRLPDTRESFNHEFEIAGNTGIITVGMYPDESPGEMFITMSKEGSTLSGLLDTVAILISFALQHGIPLESIVRKLANTRYEPSGSTKNECIPFALSLTDYIARYIGIKFIPLETLERIGVETRCHGCSKTVEYHGKRYSCLAKVGHVKEEVVS